MSHEKSQAVPRGGFFHVRSAEGPRAGYYIPERQYAARPDKYVLLEPEEERPVVHHAVSPEPVAVDAREGEFEEDSYGE